MGAWSRSLAVVSWASTAAIACGGSSTGAPVDGGGSDTSTVLWTAPDLGAIAAVALDATTIYFAYSSSIFALPKFGGTATELVQLPGDQVTALAVDASHIYFSLSQAGSINAAPLTGGAPLTLTTADVLGPLAVDSHDVYFVTGGLDRVPITGGAPMPVSAGASLFALDATTAFVATDNGATTDTANVIARQPLDGSAQTTLDTLAAGAQPVGIYSDGATVFAAIDDHTTSTFSGYVIAIPSAGGTPSTLYTSPTSAQGQDGRAQIVGPVGDGAAIYVFANYTGVNDVHADLVAVPESGDAPRTLVSQQAAPVFIAGVDASAVYYVDRRSADRFAELRAAPLAP